MERLSHTVIIFWIADDFLKSVSLFGRGQTVLVKL